MQKMRECLLIDDDQDDQEIFKMCIDKVSGDINCTTMDDAPMAIAMLNANPGYIPGHIFIDMNMPKMNGIECLKVLRTMERLNATKIFMYSTTSVQSSLDEAKQSGASGFIIKPSTAPELREILSKLFSTVPEQTGT